MTQEARQPDTLQPSSTDAERMLRVLHGHLRRKRDGIRQIADEIEALGKYGRVSKAIAKDLCERLLALVRRDEDLTITERDILDRDSRLEYCLRHNFPAMPHHLVVVCICIIDGLSTTEISSIVCKSVKAVDHYRQEIRQIVGLHGNRSSLHHHLLNLVNTCPECSDKK